MKSLKAAEKNLKKYIKVFKGFLKKNGFENVIKVKIKRKIFINDELLILRNLYNFYLFQRGRGLDGIANFYEESLNYNYVYKVWVSYWYMKLNNICTNRYHFLMSSYIRCAFIKNELWEIFGVRNSMKVLPQTDLDSGIVIKSNEVDISYVMKWWLYNSFSDSFLFNELFRLNKFHFDRVLLLRILSFGKMSLNKIQKLRNFLSLEEKEDLVELEFLITHILNGLKEIVDDMEKKFPILTVGEVLNDSDKGVKNVYKYYYKCMLNLNNKISIFLNNCWKSLIKKDSFQQNRNLILTLVMVSLKISKVYGFFYEKDCYELSVFFKKVLGGNKGLYNERFLKTKACINIKKIKERLKLRFSKEKVEKKEKKKRKKKIEKKLEQYIFLYNEKEKNIKEEKYLEKIEKEGREKQKEVIKKDLKKRFKKW